MDELLRTALDAAEAAAQVQRRDAFRRVTGREKAPADWVSQTDLDAQAAALAVIRVRHPDHVILAEESEEGVEERLARAEGRPTWLVDPLDGTTNFLHGHPFHCASVAVAVEGRPVAGAVVSGSSGERWWAREGAGAFKSGRRIRVSDRDRMREALVGTGFPFKRLELLPEYLGQLDRVLQSTSGVRRAGSAALDLCFLGEGALDVFWEEFLNPWDFAAGVVIVREAGGVLADADGAELALRPGPVRAANSRSMLDALMATLKG